VATSRGDCFAEGTTGRRVLAPAAAVFVGDAVGTGSQSALGLHLGTATEVRLGAEARLRIDRFLVNAGGVLVLERGALLYDHSPDAGPSDVTVRSSYGLVAVRGTKFFAGPSNGVFGVFVERGSVTVVGANTAVLVVSGMGTNLAAPGAKPTAPAPWGAGRIAAAMASVS
jgi:ferric-dicitrate binding protein FerR (iron transport regulator)